jgi:hypothetical protein
VREFGYVATGPIAFTEPTASSLSPAANPPEIPVYNYMVCTSYVHIMDTVLENGSLPVLLQQSCVKHRAEQGESFLVSPFKKIRSPAFFLSPQP